jgi:mono/diheme cytochrome c family protein
MCIGISTGLNRVAFAAGLAVALCTAHRDARAEAPPRDHAQLAEAALALLAKKCTACHGDKKRESGLDLRTAAAALKGGESGPAVVPRSAEKSLLYERLAAGEMPPREEDRLNEDEIALVREWIDHAVATPAPTNASDDFAERARHWSFARPVRPAVPEIAAPEGDRAANPIDAFVIVKLREMKLSPAPLADRRTLARRAHFDLLGLPPSPERVEKFVADENPQAYEQLIDELLASPQYGERWARHWLDVARYADTGGYETDIYFKNAWRYRDYVVKSFNDDKPYDLFVQEQIAGDELWPDNLDLGGSYVMPPEKIRHLEARLGTGLYALGTQIHESNMDAGKLRNERLSDWVDTTGAAFLGLTIGCARCHDHKFDAITQRDYYGLQAVFAGSRETETPIVNAMEIADQKQHYPRILAVDEARRAYRLFEQSLAGRTPTPDDEKRRNDLLVAIGRAVLAMPDKAASTPGTPFDGLMEVPTASVLGHEQPELVPDIRLLSRGDLARPKEQILPCLPSVLAEKSGRDPSLPGPYGSRKELALWLTRPDHPLTARVMVNRIWDWHFGRGIVATPNDFGRMGQPPSNPELLDWLAIEFAERGWSVKQVHRLIMLSRTYRQASDMSAADHDRADPENRFLWRMNRRRLEAESLWDAIHTVAGTLHQELGGRPVMPPLTGEEQTDKANWVTSVDPKQHVRRGLYIVVRRNFRFPLFDIFDAPVNAVSCAGRDCSTVAPQALWLLNNHVAYGQSQKLAARVVREAGAEPDACIRRAWQLCLQRLPTSDEAREAAALVESLAANDAGSAASAAAKGEPPPAELAALSAGRAAALNQLCLALLNLHEFVFVD